MRAAGGDATSNCAESAGVRPSFSACREYPVPGVSIAQPAKMASPNEVVNGLVAHASDAPEVPVPDVIDSPIPAVSLLSTLPAASSTTTVGCVENGLPIAAPAGSLRNASFAAVVMKISTSF